MQNAFFSTQLFQHYRLHNSFKMAQGGVLCGVSNSEFMQVFLFILIHFYQFHTKMCFSIQKTLFQEIVGNHSVNFVKEPFGISKLCIFIIAKIQHGLYHFLFLNFSHDFVCVVEPIWSKNGDRSTTMVLGKCSAKCFYFKYFEVDILVYVTVTVLFG